MLQWLVLIVCILWMIWTYDAGVDVRIRVVDLLGHIVVRLCGAYDTIDPFIDRTTSLCNFKRTLFEMVTGYSLFKKEVKPGGCVDGSTGVYMEDVLTPALVRVYRGRETSCKRTIMLYLHGGGGCMQHYDSPGVHRLCMRLACEGYLVVNVEYRLSPESPFPAALWDCYTALQWCHGRNHTLLQDTHDYSLVVGGNSAGN